MEDFLKNAKSYGRTPDFHKVEIVRNEIIYVPDRENYPAYWEQKAREEIEKNKLRCSYKVGRSPVMDCLKEKGILFNLEELSIIEGSLSPESIRQIEEEFFEISRSELLILTPYHNITPFVYSQLIRAYPNREKTPFICEACCSVYSISSSKENQILILEKYGNQEKQAIISWMDYVSFLKKRDFDIPQHAVPGY